MVCFSDAKREVCVFAECYGALCVVRGDRIKFRYNFETRETRNEGTKAGQSWDETETNRQSKRKAGLLEKN